MTLGPANHRFNNDSLGLDSLKNLPPEIAKDATSLMVLLYKYE